MRNPDLSPLFRHSIGFDRLGEMFEAAARGGQDSSYPPYDIVKLDGDRYRITLAVAGFAEDELEIVSKENVLTVTGRASPSDDKGVHYLHRGIARRAFEHRFQLADHVRVQGANLAHGLLDIELLREIPETMKPQRIQIGRG